MSQDASPSTTSADGNPASDAAGNAIFEPRMPLPITTTSRPSTALSIRIGHSAGSPIGVMPPYSIAVSRTASSIGANDALRAPSRRRTTPFTSARIVASTTHAAYDVTSARRPAITTQFAESSSDTPYRSQNAAVSASVGSIGATATSSVDGHESSALATGAATRSA